MNPLRIVAAMLVVLTLAACGTPSDPMNENETMDHWAPLARYIDDRKSEFGSIPAERKAELESLAAFVATARDTGVARLTFICTHNSRRSHFGQIWAQVAAHHFGVDSLVETYSGGTEATAFNGRAVGALRRAGLDIHPAAISDNPKYAVHYAEGIPPMICFSKEYGDGTVNPVSGFAAVMTCSEADRGCPLVYGSAARFSTPYVDPKESDGTPAERETYDERCAQIAREMLYVMSSAGS